MRVLRKFAWWRRKRGAKLGAPPPVEDAATKGYVDSLRLSPEDLRANWSEHGWHG